MGFQFNQGDKVRDRVTRFEGVIVGRADYISGCNTYGVQCPAKPKEAPGDPRWFDEPRLELVKRSAVSLVDNARTGAGPSPRPTRSVG